MCGIARGFGVGLCASMVALSNGAGIDAQRPSSGTAPPPTVQKQAEDFASMKVEELTARARGWTLGTLHPEADQLFQRWDAAVRQWKKERGAGAAALLAEGVLFDCLGRLEGVKTLVVSSEFPLPAFADLAAQRPARAAKAFDAALKIDPHLIEARMRTARIHAIKDVRADLDLEKIANDETESPFPYLAAISRAALAQSNHDAASAIRWYERSLQLNPRSTAASIGLSTLKPTMSVRFESLDPNDPYYTYPCTVLTSSAATALAERINKVVMK